MERSFVLLKHIALGIVKILTLTLSLVIPTLVIVLPYCYILAAVMPPANTTGGIITTMAALVFGAVLMGGIPLTAWRLYGRKLEVHMWP